MSLSVMILVLSAPSKAFLRVSADVFSARPITISVFSRTEEEITVVIAHRGPNWLEKHFMWCFIIKCWTGQHLREWRHVLPGFSFVSQNSTLTSRLPSLMLWDDPKAFSASATVANLIKANLERITDVSWAYSNTFFIVKKKKKNVKVLVCAY